MKLDYNYLKKILTVMEENPKHITWVCDIKKEILESDDDKFIGHIKILFDFGCIEGIDGEIGIRMSCDGQAIWGNVPYRLTAKGYEFLDILKNDTVFQKIKNFAISNALEIGKQMLITLAMNKLS